MQKQRKKQKFPNYIIIIFGLFFALAAFNVVRDVSASGVKPFGFIDRIVAQVTGRPAVNTSSIVRDLFTEAKIQDTLDRCEVIDPNLDNGFAFAAELGNSNLVRLNDNIGGLNIAALIGGGKDALDYKATLETATRLGMGYVLGMVTDPGQSPNTAQFIKDANLLDLTPIIRLCYPGAGGCDFPLASSIDSVVTFYKKVSADVGNDNEFIAMVGPNEPGTAGEMEAFGFGAPSPVTYPQLVNKVNDAAEALKDLRVKNGGNMYIAPGAFNLTNNVNNDAVYMVSSAAAPALFPDRFDVFLGNTYDFKGVPAYEYYVGNKAYPPPDPGPEFEGGAKLAGRFNLKQYIVQNNLRMIITEFGTFDAPLSQLKETFDKFCADETIDGVMFFRSFETLLAGGESIPGSKVQPEPHPTFIDLDEIADIITGCSRAKTSERDFAWKNCNQDSCLYPHQYDTRSVANVCATEVDVPSAYRDDNGAALKGSCVSGGDCTFKMQQTVRVDLPIKQFGSNSAYGSNSKQFTPTCVEMSILYANSEYDALNQFAGELRSGSLRYAMPWLGSAINCSSQLIQGVSNYPKANLAPSEFKPNTGSEVQRSYEEIRKEYDTGSSQPGSPYYKITDQKDGKTVVLNEKILDERALLYQGYDKYIDKTNEYSFVRGLKDYDPTSSKIKINALDTKKVSNNTCDPNFKYEINDGNYISGPEIKVGKVKEVARISSVEACLAYGKRNTESPDKRFVFKGNVKCALSSGVEDFPCTNGLNFKTAFKEGKCDGLSQFYVNQLVFQRVDKPSQQELEKSGEKFNEAAGEIGIYFKVNEYAPAPKFYIPGMYDTIYRQYLRLQSELSKKGQKVVFKENIGWQAKVASLVRDANRPYENKRPYLYRQTLESCQLADNVFNNEFYLAKNNPIKTTYQYYDWLGYTDILQEWTQALVNSKLTEVIYSDNKFRDNEKYPTLKDRQAIMQTGSSSLVSSFPILTCDDIEELKYDEGIPLNDRIKENVFGTCLTNSTDKRLTDDLGQFLCSKGYQVPGICEEQSICNAQQVDIILPEDVTQAQLYSFPIGSDRQIPDCREPEKLETPLNSLRDLPYFAGNFNNKPSTNRSEFKLVPEASSKFVQMMNDMKQSSPESYNTCGVNWAYRSAETQGSFTEACGPGTAAACKCYSEHQLGTSIDFRPKDGSSVNNFSRTACYSWLRTNASKYGFIQSYKSGNPDGYNSSSDGEPWHFRWLPQNLADEFTDTAASYGGHLKNYLIESWQQTTGTGTETKVNIDPLKGKGTISQGYGEEALGVGGHNGIDYGAAEGTEVYPIAPGVVRRFIANQPQNTYPAKLSYGNYVIIEHKSSKGETFYSLYAHLQQTLVNTVGQQVTTDTVIGRLGNSGYSTRAHLHLEVRRPNQLDCNDGYSTTTKLGTCTFDPLSQEFADFLSGGVTGTKCGDVKSSKEFASLDCLISAVADFASEKNGIHYPPEMLKAILKIETGADDDEGKEYTGDPLQRANVKENTAGASGPMQFTPLGWTVVDSNTSTMMECMRSLGIEVETVLLDHRNFLGPALCAATIKNLVDARAYLPSGTLATLKSFDDWVLQKFPANQGQAPQFPWDSVSYNLSALQVVSRKYYGACKGGPPGSGPVLERYDYCIASQSFAKGYQGLSCGQ